MSRVHAVIAILPAAVGGHSIQVQLEALSMVFSRSVHGLRVEQAFSGPTIQPRPE